MNSNLEFYCEGGLIQLTIYLLLHIEKKFNQSYILEWSKINKNSGVYPESYNFDYIEMVGFHKKNPENWPEVWGCMFCRCVNMDRRRLRFWTVRALGSHFLNLLGVRIWNLWPHSSELAKALWWADPRSKEFFHVSASFVFPKLILYRKSQASQSVRGERERKKGLGNKRRHYPPPPHPYYTRADLVDWRRSNETCIRQVFGSSPILVTSTLSNSLHGFAHSLKITSKITTWNSSTPFLTHLQLPFRSCENSGTDLVYPIWYKKSGNNKMYKNNQHKYGSALPSTIFSETTLAIYDCSVDAHRTKDSAATIWIQYSEFAWKV
jgi:hypothetical protein